MKKEITVFWVANEEVLYDNAISQFKPMNLWGEFADEKKYLQYGVEDGSLNLMGLKQTIIVLKDSDTEFESKARIVRYTSKTQETHILIKQID